MAWNVYRCPRCLDRFGGSNLNDAIDRFLSHPKHDCIADILAGKTHPYTKVGTKR